MREVILQKSSNKDKKKNMMLMLMVRKCHSVLRDIQISHSIKMKIGRKAI